MRGGSPSVGEEDSGVGHALSDFLLLLENYNPSVPDAVVAHYLNNSGFESQDPRCVKFCLAPAAIESASPYYRGGLEQ